MRRPVRRRWRTATGRRTAGGAGRQSCEPHTRGPAQVARTATWPAPQEAPGSGERMTGFDVTPDICPPRCTLSVKRPGHGHPRPPRHPDRDQVPADGAEQGEPERIAAGVGPRRRRAGAAGTARTSSPEPAWHRSDTDTPNREVSPNSRATGAPRPAVPAPAGPRARRRPRADLVEHVPPTPPRGAMAAAISRAADVGRVGAAGATSPRRRRSRPLGQAADRRGPRPPSSAR